MKLMTYSLRGLARPRVAPARHAGIFAFALLATLSNSVAAPADPTNGERLAKRWCASCHIVSADQTRGADNVPPFAAIAKTPGFSGEKIGQFLLDPHPKMPDMQLTRDEARDLGAYIAGLAQ
jgi:mono/diheme cytochrome c family protein